MKIAFFEIEPLEKEYVKNQLVGHEVVFFDEKLSEKNIDQVTDCHIIATFVDSRLPKEVLSQLPELKMIAARSTGFDHIDLEECKKRNITVCNVPFYGENTVAEHAFALILDLSRKIHQSVAKTKRGDFSLDGLRGFDLAGKTLGVVGMGHIGQHVARMARGFEMKVLGFDVHQDKKLAKKLGFSYVSLEELLAQSDVISLHAPYNQHTHHLLNSNNMPLIKKGAYLINTARGGLIQTAALIEALKNGTLAGAGLDVLEEENVIKEEISLLSKLFSSKHNLAIVTQDHMLMKMENVIITPHNAFNSNEALQRILETTIINIKGFIEGKPENIVK